MDWDASLTRAGGFVRLASRWNEGLDVDRGLEIAQEEPMKILPAIFAQQMHTRAARRNLRTLGEYLLALTALVGVYSVLFHFLMAWEGQRYSWLTGVYWTLTVMSTLGFGDITFHSDAWGCHGGRPLSWARSWPRPIRCSPPTSK